MILGIGLGLDTRYFLGLEFDTGTPHNKLDAVPKPRGAQSYPVLSPSGVGRCELGAGNASAAESRTLRCSHHVVPAGKASRRLIKQVIFLYTRFVKCSTTDDAFSRQTRPS